MATINGTAGGDNLVGGDEDDLVRGRDGDDTLDGGTGGADLLQGGDGVDRLNGGGFDTLDGGAGVDLGNIFLFIGAPVDLDLDGLTAGGTLNTDYGIRLEGLEAVQVFTGDTADTIRLGGVDGFVNSAGGADSVTGGSGNDYIRGGTGDDTLDGGGGFDRVGFYTEAANGARVDLRITGVQDTGAGLDVIRGFEGVSGTAKADQLIGDGGDNWLWGSGPAGPGANGADTLIGNSGDDLLVVSQGDHSVVGGRGVDTLEVAGNNVDLSGGLTVDLDLQGERQNTGQGSMYLSGIENVSGSRFGDSFSGDRGGNVLAGEAGADSLVGRAGADFLLGDGLIDVVAGPFGFGGEVRTVVRLDTGGDDTLAGGTGADSLVGGLGADRLTGGADADIFYLGNTADSTAAAADRITDFDTAQDVLDLAFIDADILADGNQAFVLVRNFSGAAGEARLTYDRGTRTTTLELNTDADAEAEAIVLFSGRITRDALNDDSFVG
jgi:Ca2+-binding RTX toxin-like protein